MTAKLYPGIAFSPVAELTDNVGAGDTIIPVSDVEAFPPAPNLATIGTDEEGETILYAAKTATALSGCTRGVEGTARAWSAGEPIARNWTAKDHGDLITFVEGAAEAAQNTQNALAEHQADASAHGELFAAKQPKLTGQPGQVVGFDGMGLAYAVPGWSNPNLLDNWYFVDPVNQRGQTEYIGNADPIYTLDRWKLAGLSTSNAKLELVDGGVRITSGNAFCQIVENNVTRALIGKTVTVSALMDIEIPPVAGQLGIVADNEWIGSTPLPATTGTDILVSATISIGNVSTLIPWIYSAPGGVYKLKAIKLEQGPVQTLAHQDADGNWVLNDPPPDKALELAKCQRYQVVYNMSLNDTNHSILVGTGSLDGLGGDGKIYGQGVINLPAPLRGKPAIPPGIKFYAVNANTPIEVYGMWIDQNLLRINYTVDGSTPMDNKIGMLYCTNTIIDANL